jgi:hypothetical protein
MGPGDYWNEESAFRPTIFTGCTITAEVEEEADVGALDAMGAWSRLPLDETPAPYAHLTPADIRHTYQASRLVGKFRRLQQLELGAMVREWSGDPGFRLADAHAALPPWTLVGQGLGNAVARGGVFSPSFPKGKEGESRGKPPSLPTIHPPSQPSR